MNQDTDKNRWSVIAAIAVVTITATALYVTLPVPSPVELSGRVQCTSGARVVGVWIEAPKGDAGWAEMTAASTDQSQTAYRHRLRYGTQLLSSRRLRRQRPGLGNRHPVSVRALQESRLPM